MQEEDEEEDEDEEEEEEEEDGGRTGVRAILYGQRTPSASRKREVSSVLEVFFDHVLKAYALNLRRISSLAK